MSSKLKIIVASLLSVVLFQSATYLYSRVMLSNRLSVALKASETEIQYQTEANRITAYLYRSNVAVRTDVIIVTLKAVDKYLPKYFPKGPYQREDFIALALTESCYNPYLVGKAGEKGIFQIMEEASSDMGVTRNQFDIDTNTELAMFVLSQKFKKYPDYKKAIIAYNGIVFKKGKLIDQYWKRFSEFRRVIDDVLGGIELPKSK